MKDYEVAIERCVYYRTQLLVGIVNMIPVNTQTPCHLLHDLARRAPNVAHIVTMFFLDNHRACSLHLPKQSPH